MKSFSKRFIGFASKLAILAVVLYALVGAPIQSSAHMTSTSITVANNSSRSIRHLYVSPPESDSWSDDQLSNTSINHGDSVTFSNISCSGSSIKVIGEDVDGCFVTTVVSCSESSTWTITDADARDCGN